VKRLGGLGGTAPKRHPSAPQSDHLSAHADMEQRTLHTGGAKKVEALQGALWHCHPRRRSSSLQDERSVAYGRA